MTFFPRMHLGMPLFLALTLVGCATAPPERVSVGPELAGTIEIEEVMTRRTAGGLLEVEVPIHNLMDRPVLMTYQFDWLDEEGQVVPSLLSSKVRATADRRRWISIRGIAPSPEVNDFRLYLDERED